MTIHIKNSDTRHNDYFWLSKANNNNNKKNISNNYFLAIPKQPLEMPWIPNATRRNAKSKSLKNTDEKVRFHQGCRLVAHNLSKNKPTRMHAKFKTPFFQDTSRGCL